MLGNLELIARLMVAAALGSVIGFERERLSWAAGLRTTCWCAWVRRSS